MEKRSVYMDHAATTAVDPRVVEAMLPYWTEVYGNPSSIYAQGREAHKALDTARGKVASILGARPDEIVFTGCGTESDNLALEAFLWLSAKRATTSSPRPSSIMRLATRPSSCRSTLAWT